MTQAAIGADLHVNSDKKECMRFKQIRTVSKLHGTLLKFVDKFPNLGRNIYERNQHTPRKSIDCYYQVTLHLKMSYL